MAQANQHLNVINKLYEEVYTNGNINVLEHLCTSDIKINDPAASNAKKGIQGFKELEMSYKMAFPTRTVRVDQTWKTDDSIIAHWTINAIHKGTFLDIPATGKSIKISGITIFKFSNNKISEIIQNWDRLGLYEQLGLSFHAKAGW